MKRFIFKAYWLLAVIVGIYCMIADRSFSSFFLCLLMAGGIYIFYKMLIYGLKKNIVDEIHRDTTKHDKAIANNIYQSIKASERQSRVNAQIAEQERAAKNAKAAAYFRGEAKSHYGTKAGREAQRKADLAKNNRYF